MNVKLSKHRSDISVIIDPPIVTASPLRKASDPVITRNKKLQNILIPFFSFAYTLCFSPFQIIEDCNGHLRIKTWLPQQIICAIGTLSSVVFRGLEIWIELPQENTNWNPVLYFKLFHRVLNIIFNLNIWITVWFKKSQFLAILQFIQSRMTSATYENLQIKMSRILIVILTLNTISIITYFIFGTDIFPVSQWHPTLLFHCFASHIKSGSFCVISCGSNQDLLKEDIMSPTIIFLTVLFTVCRLLRKILGMYEELLMLVGPLTLWLAVKDFTINVFNKQKVHTWPMISKRYEDLNELAELVNRAFGPILLSYTLTALFYFSINLDEFLTVDDTLKKIKFLMFYTLIISTFTISAEIVRQAGQLAPWISKNLQDSLYEITEKELTVVLHEISSTRIGMSACGLFTVTYSVVAQMTGVLVTYFIITVQYRDQK